MYCNNYKRILQGKNKLNNSKDKSKYLKIVLNLIPQSNKLLQVLGQIHQVYKRTMNKNN